jgi:hypothetical protein
LCVHIKMKRTRIGMPSMTSATKGTMQCVCTLSCLLTSFVVARVGHSHTFIGIYGVHTVFVAGKLPYIRSYTVQMCGSGQP